MNSSINHVKDSSVSCEQFTSAMPNGTIDSCSNEASSESGQWSKVNSPVNNGKCKGTNKCQNDVDKNGNSNMRSEGEQFDTLNVKVDLQPVQDNVSRSTCNAAKFDSAAASSNVISERNHLLNDWSISSNATNSDLALNGDRSFSFGDTFRNLHSAIGSGLSSNSSIHRLLRNKPIKSSLQRSLSLTMPNTTTSVANHATSVLPDSNWFSTQEKNIGAMMSPTFSMADIAVVVPPHIQDDGDDESSNPISERIGIKEKQLTSSTEANLTETERSCSVDIHYVADDEPSDIYRTPDKNSDNIDVQLLPYNNSVSVCESVVIAHSRVDTKHSDSSPKNSNDFTINASTQETPLEQSIQERNLGNSSDFREKPCFRSDSKDLFVSKVKDRTTTCHKFPNDTPHETPILTSNKTLAHTNDVSEWQFVENARSKQKRRHCQSLRSTAPVAVLDKQHSNVPNLKRQDDKFPPTWSSFSTKQSSTSQPLRRFPPATLQTKPKLQSGSNNLKSAITTAKDKSEVVRSAENSQHQLCTEDLDSIDSRQDLRSQDDLKSQALKENPSNAQSSSVVNQGVQASNMVAVSDCEKVNADEPNSTVTRDVANHASDQSSFAERSMAAPARADDDQKPTESEKLESNENASPKSPSPKLQGEELTRQLKNQLEYYFSRENLAQDPYLVSQMNSEQYVPIYIIAHFNAIKKLTSDINEVIEALKSSRLVEVDEKSKMVRPNPNRCAIILREIPEAVQQEEVCSLFVDCPVKFTYCEYAGNTNWYVLFDSENDAQIAHRHLRENVKEFKGKPILARIKTKSHHLNTYSFQTLSSNVSEPKEQSPVHNAQESQQVQMPPAVDFLQPPFLVAPQVPFSQHPGAPVAAIPPSLLTRVAAPTSVVPAPSSGQGPTAMTVNPPFVVTATPWGAGFYPGDHALMGNPLANPFLPTAYKPSPVAHYTSGAAKSQSSSTGHRYTDYHKGVAGQRNSFDQRKSSNPSFSQQQPLPNSALPKSRYVLTTDPNPPNLIGDSMAHYVQADQGGTHVAHSMTSSHHGHYLPAVNAPLGTSYVTPNVNDSSIFLFPPMNLIPAANIHPRSGSRRGGQVYAPHRASHGDQNMGHVNGHRNNRYNHSRSNNNYHPEISPRFLPKGSAAHQQFVLHNQQFVQFSTSNEPNHEMKSYSNKSHNSSSSGSSQRSRNYPHADNSVSESEKQHGYHHDNERYSHSMNHETRRFSAHQRSSTPPDQKNLLTENRRNSKPRRARRNDDDDERTASVITAASAVKTTFNLESNSFPPLPGASEPDSSAPPPDNRPAAADMMKSSDTVKTPAVAEPNPVPSSTPKKYSEVSSASHVTRNHSAPAKPTAPSSESNKPAKKTEAKKMEAKKTEAKLTSAVNTQPVADKHPPAINRRASSKQAATDRKPDQKQSSARPRSTSSNNSSQSSFGKKTPVHKEPKKSAPVKAEAAAKIESSNKSEAPKRPPSDSNEASVKDETSNDDKESNDSNDRRPTYAEIMKANKANQLNGKSASDSGNSESGDDNHAVDEGKESEETPAEPEKVVRSSRERPERDGGEGGRGDRRGGSNSFSRRNYGDADRGARRGSWHGRPYYRDRNHEYRTDRHRERGNGHWDFRGGHRGFRGRRGFRADGRYHSGGRPMPSNGQSPNDR